MFSLKNIKLKHQLAILIIIAVLAMIMAEVVFYYRFYLLTQERAEDFSVKTTNQLEEEINFFASEIKQVVQLISYNKFYQRYILSEDPAEMMQLSSSIIDLFETVRTMNRSIVYIQVTDHRGKKLGSYTSNSADKFDQYVPLEMAKYSDHIDDYLNVKEWPYLSTFKMTQSAPLSDPTNGNYFMYMDRVVSTSILGDTDRNYAICIVVCRTKSIQTILNNSNLTKNSKMIILDDQNKVLSSNAPELINTEFTQADIPLGDTSYIKKSVLYDNKRSIVLYKYIGYTDWKVISIIPVAELTGDMNDIKMFGISAGLGMVLLLLSIGIIISNSITKPVQSIIEFLNLISAGQNNNRLSLLYKNEVGILAHYINDMLDNIEIINKSIITAQSALYESKLVIKHAEVARKQAELSALYSQINPHFLYNTFECIRCIGIDANNMEIERIATSLAKIFRYSIKRTNFSLVQEEIECINNYLEIMLIRYMNKFTVEILVEKDLMSKKIIKMLLQPLVENAIYHGLERKNGPGKLMIKGSIENNNLINFEVQDNGIGIKEHDLSVLKASLASDSDDYGNDSSYEKRSIGLLNIHKRIRLTYGNQYGLKIESRENEGTCVFINIPAVEI